MAKNDFQYGGWNSYTLRCGTIMTLISPGGSTLQCGRWLWHDIPLNSPKRPPYLNSASGFDFDHITAVDMTFCTSQRNFIQIGPPSAKKIKSCRFSYRSSVDTIALNCLVFLRKSHFCILATDRLTDKQVDITNALSK